MALPEYYKEYCLDGHKYRTGLDGITVNDKPVNEFLKTEEQKEVESVYKEDISSNSNKNPVRFGKPRFKSKKERDGKVKNITPEEYYNQDPNGNFGKCTRIKDVVISLLLSGVSATSKQFFFDIEKRSTQNIELKSLIAKEKFKMDKMYTIMWELKKSVLGSYISKVPLTKNAYGYYLKEEAKSFTLEKAVKLSKRFDKKHLKIKLRKPVRTDLPKKTIRKAVKKAKDQRESFNQSQLEFLNKMLSQIILKEDFKNYIEDMNERITDLKSLVNKLMINTPANDLKESFSINSNKIEVEVKGGIDINFRFLL